MADRSILFSAPMVRALLAGTKTQTRRLMPRQDALAVAYSPIVSGTCIFNYAGEEEISRPRYRVGDRLYVREAWRTGRLYDKIAPRLLRGDGMFRYEADGAEDKRIGPGRLYTYGKLRPGMFMPRWASRLTLVVTDVRVQRLNEISGADAKAEGASWINPPVSGSDLTAEEIEHLGYTLGFMTVWDEINGALSWFENPWVAAYSFEVHHLNIDEMQT